MKNVFVVLLAFFSLCLPSFATDYTGPITSDGIKAAITALPGAGGILYLPCGTFSGDGLVMRDNVQLRGEGPCTIIPRVWGNGTPRNFGMGLEDLIVDGSITTTSGYCIDWRNASNGHIERVITRNCSLGLLLMGNAYYNLISQLFANASGTAVEIYGGANQNVVVGGKFSAPTGLNVVSVNGTSVFGTSLEDAIANMVFKVVSGDGGSTKAVGVRQEDANHSSVYWNQ